MQAHPNLYDYWPYRKRPKITWPDGKKLAFWIAPNIEFYELDPPVNPVRPSWPRPHPDVLRYGARDFGNRVGHWRLMELMDEFALRGTVSLSVAMLDHHPEIIEACCARNWEFFSHGAYNTRYSYGMNEAQERALIEDSIDSVLARTGQRIRGYLAPALTTTERTMDLLAEYDFWYTCDLFQDDQPQPLKVRSGRLISLPYNIEINDYTALVTYSQSPRAYCETIKRQFDQLLLEGQMSGTVMCLPLHAYLIGHPHRMAALREAISYIMDRKDEIWVTTGNDIGQYFRQNFYDQSLLDMESRGLARPGTGFDLGAGGQS